MTLQVGDYVHVVTGKKQTGRISSITDDKATVNWGVLDGQTFTSDHALEDLYKSDWTPPPPAETEQAKKAEAAKSLDIQEPNIMEGYGDRA